MHVASGTRSKASSIDVAALAGVSQATVSRVLTGRDPVSPATRAKVEQALTELGYRPNLLARGLKTQRTGLIAVVIADITNPFYPEIVEALSHELAASGHRMLLWNDATHGDSSEAFDAVRQGLVDGVIFTTATSDSPTLERALDLRTPVVLVNRTIDDAECDTVTSDNLAGGRNVGRYFADNDRTPAVISGPETASTSRERVTGFCEVFPLGTGLSKNRLEYGDFSHDSGVTFCHRIFDQDDPPDAIFATNDLTAFGVLDGARQVGIRVPEDLWVVGYDDIDMASWAAFDLTTVRQPSRRMAAEAVSLLRDRLDDPERAYEHLRFGSELIIRGSSGVPTVSARPTPKDESDRRPSSAAP